MKPQIDLTKLTIPQRVLYEDVMRHPSGFLIRATDRFHFVLCNSQGYPLAERYSITTVQKLERLGVIAKKQGETSLKYVYTPSLVSNGRPVSVDDIPPEAAHPKVDVNRLKDKHREFYELLCSHPRGFIVHPPWSHYFVLHDENAVPVQERISNSLVRKFLKLGAIMQEQGANETRYVLVR